MANERILIVDDSRFLAQMAASQLQTAGFQVSVAASGEEGLEKLAHEQVDFVLLDVVMPGIDGYEVCRRIRRDPKLRDVPVMMLTTKGGVAEKVAGFEAGADDYLVKPYDPAELDVRVRALLARTAMRRHGTTAAAAGPQSRVISFFTLKGGSGRTVLAVNFALVLRQLTNQPVALLDLSLQSGQVALMLDLEPKRTIDQLAREDPAALDTGLVNEYLSAHPSGLSVMAAPPSPELAELVTPALVGAMIPALQRTFRWLVIDAAPAFSEVSLTTIDRTDTIVLVTAPDIPSIRASAACIGVFKQLNLGRDRYRLLINNLYERSMLGVRDVEGALGQQAIATVPWDGERVLVSVNEGAPLAMTEPGHPIIAALEELVHRLAPKELAAVTNAPPALTRLRKRLRL